MSCEQKKKGKCSPVFLPMWSADVHQNNIRVFIIRWSIIFLTCEQFLIETSTEKHWTHSIWLVTIKYDVPWSLKKNNNFTAILFFSGENCQNFPGYVLSLIDLVQLSAESLRYFLRRASHQFLNKFIHKRVRIHSSILEPLQNSKDDPIIRVTSMKDLMEKRLASMVDRPWARQLWAMKPAFSSARHIASSPSFQFQLGMFSRWALIALTDRRGHKMKKRGENGSLDKW